MKRQTDFGKVLIVWAILVGLVIAGMVVGKMMWKRRAADKRRTANIELVKRADKLLGDAVACLGNGETDTIVGFVADLVEHGNDRNRCTDEIDAAQEVARKAALAVSTKPTASLPTLGASPAALDELCEWLRAMHADVGTLFARAKLEKKVVLPLCAAARYALPFIELPAVNQSDVIERVDAASDLQVTYATELARGTLRTKTGEGWSDVTLPPGASPVQLWTDELHLVLARDRESLPGFHAFVDVAGKWQRRGALAIDSVDWIRAYRGGLAVLAHAGDAQVLLRSTDGAKTFSTTKLVERDVQVSLLADGTPLVLSATNGFTVLELGQKPVQRAQLAWPSDSDGVDKLELCQAGDAHWAIARARHVMYSSDGETWREIQDLGKTLASIQQVRCIADRLAIAYRSAVLVCDTSKCGAPIKLATETTAIALRFDGAKLALWFGDLFAETHLQGTWTRSTIFSVYRVEGDRRVLDRVYSVDGAGKLPVAHDAQGFFSLAH